MVGDVHQVAGRWGALSDDGPFITRDDAFRGGSGHDEITAGAGHDRLDGGVGPDVLRGEAGNDWLFWDATDATVDGGPGDDRLVVVGADAVGRRRFVNSAGTGDLLAAARCTGVDIVLVADSGKDVSEDVVDEIVRLSPIHRETEDASWPIFEAVSLDLVTARVTE